MKNKSKLLGALVGFAALAAPVLAADVGDAIFPVDLKDKSRFELIFENEQRDLKVIDGSTSGKLTANAYFLRVHTDVGPYAFLDFDAGYMDPDNGDGAFYGGLGMRYLVYDTPAWRTAAHIQGHYSPGLSDGDTSYDLWDVDGGVTLSRKFKLDDQLTILPYAGPVLSMLRLNGDNNLDAEQKNVVGGAVGLSLEMRGANTIRIEVRYVDNPSISAAAGIVY